MKNLFDLTGQVAIVTGTSSGIGIEVAKALANQGANIVLLARRMDKLESVKEMIEKDYNVKALAIPCDLTIEEDIRKAVEEVIKEFGQIDILVNNAGAIVNKPTEEMSLEEWNLVVNVNLTGVFLMTKHVVPYMKEKEYGRIINISSMNGLIANLNGHIAPYTATKGGVINLTRQWGAEYSKDGITCNSIAPGMFPSEMMDTDLDNNTEWAAYLQIAIPASR